MIHMYPKLCMCVRTYMYVCVCVCVCAYTHTHHTYIPLFINFSLCRAKGFTFEYWLSGWPFSHTPFLKREVYNFHFGLL